MWKVLSQGIHMCNMKALSLVVRKLWPGLKFLFTHTRRRGHQGYDISSLDIRPGSLINYWLHCWLKGNFHATNFVPHINIMRLFSYWEIFANNTRLQKICTINLTWGSHLHMSPFTSDIPSPLNSNWSFYMTSTLTHEYLYNCTTT